MTEPEPKIVNAAGYATGSSIVAGAARAFNPLPTDHPFYAKIGRVTAEWSQFEHVLDVILWDLAGIEPARGSCVTGQLMGATPRLRAIIALSKLRSLKPEIIESATELMNKSYEVAERRNRITHDPWFADMSADTPAQFKSQSFKGGTYGMQDVDPEEIEKTIATIQRRVTAARDLAAAIWRELHPSP